MNWVGLIAGITLCVVIMISACWILFRVILPRRAREIEESVRANGAVRSTRRANFLGRASSRYVRLRGNGVLALLPDELAFFMFYPRRVFRVPLEGMERIEHPRSFLGRVAPRKLLVIHYQDASGRADAAGFVVPDPGEWADTIRVQARVRFNRAID